MKALLVILFCVAYFVVSRPQVMCPMIYDPVCADGQTFSNDCFARAANVKGAIVKGACSTSFPDNYLETSCSECRVMANKGNNIKVIRKEYLKCINTCLRSESDPVVFRLKNLRRKMGRKSEEDRWIGAVIRAVPTAISIYNHIKNRKRDDDKWVVPMALYYHKMLQNRDDDEWVSTAIRYLPTAIKVGTKVYDYIKNRKRRDDDEFILPAILVYKLMKNRKNKSNDEWILPAIRTGLSVYSFIKNRKKKDDDKWIIPAIRTGFTVYNLIKNRKRKDDDKWIIPALRTGFTVYNLIKNRKKKDDDEFIPTALIAHYLNKLDFLKKRDDDEWVFAAITALPHAIKYGKKLYDHIKKKRKDDDLFRYLPDRFRPPPYNPYPTFPKKPYIRYDDDDEMILPYLVYRYFKNRK